MKHSKYVVNRFYDFENLGFSPVDYSKLKFGSDIIAKKYGYEMADGFFAKHIDVLLSNNCMVIPSPYNHVENAATIMTKHFVNRVNELLVNANGNHVEFGTIQRKVSYTNDYGFLSKEKRKGLIENDSFYFNKQFITNKVLIFIDDVYITGTHEEKLIDVMTKENIDNQCFFLYYGQYGGQTPDIEAQLNFAGVKGVWDYIKVINECDSHVIVRTIKYVLGLDQDDFNILMRNILDEKMEQMYYGALGEGYYKIPAYQQNLEQLKGVVKR
jgi:hypothetical protein